MSKQGVSFHSAKHGKNTFFPCLQYYVVFRKFVPINQSVFTMFTVPAVSCAVYNRAKSTQPKYKTLSRDFYG